MCVGEYNPVVAQMAKMGTASMRTDKGLSKHTTQAKNQQVGVNIVRGREQHQHSLKRPEGKECSVSRECTGE